VPLGDAQRLAREVALCTAAHDACFLRSLVPAKKTKPRHGPVVAHGDGSGADEAGSGAEEEGAAHAFGQLSASGGGVHNL
jgi:hypothetical protein